MMTHSSRAEIHFGGVILEMCLTELGLPQWWVIAFQS